MVGGTALSGRNAAAVVQAATESTARQAADVQNTVKELAMTVLETDDTGALCFEYLKEAKDGAPLTGMCKAYMDAVKEANVAVQKANQAQADRCSQGAQSQASLEDCKKPPAKPVPGVMNRPF